MAEYVVARADELKPGDRKLVAVGRIQVVLFRVGDAYHALPNICPHQFGPICEGKITGAIMANADTGWEPGWFHDGEVLVCPWHGLEFRITTGQCLAYPNVRLRQYPVIVDGDDVKIAL
ncbi:MAG: Rieske (2Fe-2S) protein [Chloroflexi bacterium]|nr:Rieske (2Fe-2S) protein [Chloroflexota bacterium]